MAGAWIFIAATCVFVIAASAYDFWLFWDQTTPAIEARRQSHYLLLMCAGGVSLVCLKRGHVPFFDRDLVGATGSDTETGRSMSVMAVVNLFPQAVFLHTLLLSSSALIHILKVSWPAVRAFTHRWINAPPATAATAPKTHSPRITPSATPSSPRPANIPIHPKRRGIEIEDVTDHRDRKHSTRG